MRRRAKFTIMLVAIFALAFIMTVPVVSASAPGAINLCNPENVCTPTQIHFTQSLDCYFLGAGPGQWIGIYYFQGGLGIGCGPLEF
jgi:hypothetical protein